MRTTFSRTFFPAALLLLSALLFVGTALQMLVRDYLTDRSLSGLENDGSAIASLASAYYAEGSLSGQDFYVNLSVATQVSDADAVIFDGGGTLLLCSDQPFHCEHQGWVLNPEFVSRVFDSGILRTTKFTSDLYPQTRYMICLPFTDPHSGKPVGMVMVSLPTDANDAVLKRISDIYLFVSLLVVVLATIAMSVFARRQSKPLKNMANAASAFGHGDFTARVQVSESYTQEIEELALAFNNMASSIEKGENQRREFVANVSHELKTPMTTIGGYIDGILDGTIPQEKARHYMRIVSDETKRLSRLVRSMLDISQLQDQGGIPEEKKSQFDLCECAGQVLITFEQKITAKELQVDVRMPEHSLYTLANPDYITQVIYNLIDNAVKFCPVGGRLGLSLTESGEKIYVSISNDGETIPAQELPLLFDRFHKLDKSRSQNRDGWGLGLYIVKTIICSHGENISVTSRNSITTFTFTLPLVN